MLPALLSMLPGILGAGKGIFDLFNKHGQDRPMETANKYLNQIPGAMQPYYQPYMNAGKNALDMLTGQYGSLVNDPGGMYNKFASGYKESPGYQTRLNDAMTAVTNAQAAGGMAGSPQHSRVAADKALDLRGKDFEDYLGHVLGLYGTGLGGEQGLETQGYGASTDYANMLAQILGTKGKMGYETENAKNTANGQGWGNIFSGLGTAIGAYNDFTNPKPNTSGAPKLLPNVGGR